MAALHPGVFWKPLPAAVDRLLWAAIMASRQDAHLDLAQVMHLCQVLCIYSYDWECPQYPLRMFICDILHIDHGHKGAYM